MTSHKRPRQVTLSSEETHSDDPLDDTDSEWERITEDPVKRVAFERKCIEDELTDQKRVILLQESPSRRSHCRFWDCVPRKLNGEPNIRSAFRFNVKDLSGRYYEPNKYYHVSCMEQIFPDLSSLVEREVLHMEGGVTQLTSACWQISQFHNAIEDWFRFKGRTFEVDIYDRFRRAHAKWDRKDSTVEINHQLGDHEGSRQDCEKCEEVPDEPLRKDYFPEEPRSSLLSEVLASVVGVGHLDGLDGDSNARRCKKIRRS
ncbi:hypothetical protein N7478_010478 [Penicillium angulare]|uniref:uncharacterized protein n=1 Tax=Penicillium angulare TaxID=116970 RepID=UPI0025418419|nr:uncharacterized protein N7478_010299 [Penicillium angulare]XP_056776062.1 uncharacterized protein N7478_010478 [Penicillium angulare]KAJ5267491.1 hypothetical protein N7478_010299 [Penicillium angulare]KAJ5267670.1 hypothetical protein N7478_010478 [Penicillium angulare]